MYIARVHMRNLYPFQNYHFRKDSGCVRGIGCFGTQELWTSSFSSSIGPCHQSSCWPRLWRESLRSKFALPGSTTRASRGRHASYRRKFVATHYSHFVAAVGNAAGAGANVTVAFGAPLPCQVTASPDGSPYPTNYHTGGSNSTLRKCRVAKRIVQAFDADGNENWFDLYPTYSTTIQLCICLFFFCMFMYSKRQDVRQEKKVSLILIFLSL